MAASSTSALPGNAPSGGSAARPRTPATKKTPNARGSSRPRPWRCGLIDRAAAMQHRAEADEQAGPQQAVGGDEQGDAGETRRSEQADADQREPDLADRHEREQALEVVLPERHHRSQERRQHAEADQHRAQPFDVRRQRRLEDGDVDAGDGVDAEVAHHAGEHDRRRGRGDGVGICQPEVERHDRRLDEKAARDQREGHDHEPVAGTGRERLADLREVQRTGAPVEQRDPEQDHDRAHAVGHRERQRALQRCRPPDPVRGERVGRDAHQLEEDEHVEQVAGEREADQRAEKDQDQGVKRRPDRVEEPPCEHQRDRPPAPRRAAPARRRAGRSRSTRPRRLRPDAAPSPRSARPAGRRCRAPRPAAGPAAQPTSTATAARGRLGVPPAKPEQQLGAEQRGESERHRDRERREVDELSREEGRAHRDRACRDASRSARRWPAAAPSPPRRRPRRSARAPARPDRRPGCRARCR